MSKNTMRQINVVSFLHFNKSKKDKLGREIDIQMWAQNNVPLSYHGTALSKISHACTKLHFNWYMTYLSKSIIFELILVLTRRDNMNSWLKMYKYFFSIRNYHDCDILFLWDGMISRLKTKWLIAVW